MTLNIDPETRKVLTDADHVQSMLKSDGWTIAKDQLDKLIIDLQNINNLDLEKPETLSTQLIGRKMASELLFAWLKNLYGAVEQADVARTDRSTNDQTFIEHHDA